MHEDDGGGCEEGCAGQGELCWAGHGFLGFVLFVASDLESVGVIGREVVRFEGFQWRRMVLFVQFSAVHLFYLLNSTAEVEQERSQPRRGPELSRGSSYVMPP